MRSAGRPNSSTTACSGTAPSTRKTGTTCRSPSSTPASLGNVGFGTNGPNYRIRGVETSFIAVITRGLTAQGAASWNSSTQTNSPYLIANNPHLLSNPATKGEYGQPILSVQNPYGPAGGPSANSPPLQFNMRLRYQWAIAAYNAFAQAGGTHTAHSFTQSSSNPALSAGGNVSTTLLRFENPAYTTVRCLHRRRQGCLERGVVCAESDQPEQEHVHLDQPVRARGDHPAAARDRGQDRL